MGVREEPRLTEQAFGNFQNVEGVRYSKAERSRFGRFYYRFPDGESGLDVYTRVTSFLSTLYGDFADESIQDQDLHVVIVTHGLTLRLVRAHLLTHLCPTSPRSTRPASFFLTFLTPPTHSL